MAVPEREDSCTIIWNPRGLRLDELAKFTSLLADLHSEVAVPYVTSQEFDQSGSNVAAPASPLMGSLRMGSPLVAQLLGEGGAGAISALGLVGYILNKPERLGRFLPGISEGRYRGKTRELEARLEYLEARSRFEARGRSIERFEREYRSRGEPRRESSRTRLEREIRNRRNRDDRGGGGRPPR
jgi:hypothetical protein